ncbi:Craniofacial development protein 2like [Caligus rogercresseyi]|uniref:Craniofacial development protein 2like n=1 Tax=Caligus rogercresseyi TaxID=217165 RepID=A0A7T8QW26_CALRO|nr:Craniofacial development protein 2like [Caligus rogercresseyi]
MQAAVDLDEYLLAEASEVLLYVLLTMFQSNNIEERFGWYRQLSGANYYISVRQILEAEKKIIKSLVKFNCMTILEIKKVLVGIDIQKLKLSSSTGSLQN